MTARGGETFDYAMPSLGADMDEGRVIEWRSAIGDTVHRGDLVAVVQTEKSDIDIEIWHDGVVEQFLVEVDVPTIFESVRRTHRALVVDEGWRTGGLCAEIAAAIAETCFWTLDAPVARLAAVEVPIPYAKHLESAAIPQVDDIVVAAHDLVGGGA